MKNKQNTKDFTDQLIYFSIHEDELVKLTKKERKFLEQFKLIEFYKDGKKKGKKFDKVKEFKRIIMNMIEIRGRHEGKESNIECICLDQLNELLRRMMLKDVRRLELEKILLP